MQATAPPASSLSSELAHDVFAFMAHLLTASSQDVFRTLGELDVSLTQIKLLHLLAADEDGVPLKDLAERMSLSLPAISRSVDGLLLRGLVDRRENETDRRMKQVRITQRGRDVTRRVNEARLSLLEQFTATLTDTQCRRLSVALAPIVARDEVAACRPAKSRRHD